MLDRAVIAAIDRFEKDLGVTAADPMGMRIHQLRSEVRTVFAEAPQPSLTSTEREAVRIAGYLYTFLRKEVVADGPTKDDDLAQLRWYVHGIQRAVMANAAARALPNELRLLGGVINKEEK